VNYKHIYTTTTIIIIIIIISIINNNKSNVTQAKQKLRRLGTKA